MFGTRAFGLRWRTARTSSTTSSVWIISSPGMPVQSVIRVATKAGDILRRHLAKAAKELTDHFLSQAARIIEGEYEGDLGRAVEALRPLGLDAVRVVFAQEMEKALAALRDSGRAARLPTRKKKKTR